MLKKILPSSKEIDESKIKLKPFINNYYGEHERENQFKSYSRIINTTYKDKEELGFEIEEFIKESRYSLKLVRLKNKLNVTYACSCSSKGKHGSNDSESIENDSNMEVTSSKEDLLTLKNKKERKIKRNNQDSCTFRIRFEHVPKGYIVFKGIQLHNHSPTNYKKVSLYAY